jgi:DNA-binding HxlR family transcriptional regulator
LRELEADQVVARKVYPEVPPKVEYSLTAFGRTLEPVLRTLQGWGVNYLEQITQIRKERA